MTPIAIVGVGETPAVRRSEKSLRALVVEAVSNALDDAGLEPSDVDGILSDGLVMPTTVPRDFVAAQFGIDRRYDGGMSFGGAGSACAPQLAQLAISSGLAKVVVYYFGVDWGTRTSGPYGFHDLYAGKMAFEKPYGFNAQPSYFALWARRYMHEYGLTERDLATIAVTQRASALLNPRSQSTKPMSYDDYFAARVVSDPLARARLLPHHRRRRRFRHDEPGARPRPAQAAGPRARHRLRQRARQRRRRFHAAGRHDAHPRCQGRRRARAGSGRPHPRRHRLRRDLRLLQHLLPAADRGGRLLQARRGRRLHPREGHRDRRRFPINTHGGLLSHSYLLGVEHVIEAVRQLRGESGKAQVKDARVGFVGGLSNPDYGVLVLGKD